jgi:enamine deaminase RidA (YjgF/YER057c/UK114 family)
MADRVHSPRCTTLFVTRRMRQGTDRSVGFAAIANGPQPPTADPPHDACAWRIGPISSMSSSSDQPYLAPLRSNRELDPAELGTQVQAKPVRCQVELDPLNLRRRPGFGLPGRRDLSQWFDQQMTSVELVRTSALTDTVPYAYAAVTPPGRMVFTAGACPLDQNGVVVSPGDVAAQAQQVMANLVVALGAAGAGLTDVVKTTVYVASSSRADLVTAWRVVSEAFGDHDAPSTLLGVAALGYSGQLVEVEAVAVTSSGLVRRRASGRPAQ